MAQERAAGPVVLVDAGDALATLWPSAIEKADREVAEKRADFLLSQLGAMGYGALAVGERELVFPYAELAKKAAAAKLPLLAANLVDPEDKKPFPGRTMARAGGRRVGIFAVVDGGEYERHQLRCKPAAGAAQAEADALRKEGAEVVVGLLHMNYDAALRVAGELKGVDYVVQAHEGRPVLVQQAGATLLVGAGQRGQVVGRAVFDLQGAGPFVKVDDPAQARVALLEQEGTIKNLKERQKASATQDERARLGVALVAAERRYEQARAQAKPPAGRRSVVTDRAALDAKVADDRKTKAAQDAALQAAPERRK
ncbi:MAG TPA: hypothetical protein VGK67_15755 [Myxococcales bacterium]